MSAETLRRAAALMRERADAASVWEGLPWFSINGAIYGGTAAPHQVVAPMTTYEGDAEHIASWHPAVALAVADLLEGLAGDHWDFRHDEALAVARAYLGGDA